MEWRKEMGSKVDDRQAVNRQAYKQTERRSIGQADATRSDERSQNYYSSVAFETKKKE